jgi:hypothetical protein
MITLKGPEIVAAVTQTQGAVQALISALILTLSVLSILA